jgi:hypothetical protein
MTKLSDTMTEALALVPETWQKPPVRGFKLRRRRVDHPLFQPTFVALKDRGLIEWRGGPGTWEWRRAPVIELTPRQRDLARHALGLPNGRHRSYRNHFVAGEGHDDYADWMQMVDAGAAVRHGPSALYGGDYCFTLTKAGAKAALHRGERLDREDFPAKAA